MDNNLNNFNIFFVSILCAYAQCMCAYRYFVYYLYYIRNIMQVKQLTIIN